MKMEYKKKIEENQEIDMQDIIIRMPPVSKWSIKVKVKSLEKAIPHIVEPIGRLCANEVDALFKNR